MLQKINDSQYNTLQYLIKNNVQFKICGFLYRNDTDYLDKNNKVWLKSDHTGFYAKSELLSLLNNN